MGDNAEKFVRFYNTEFGKRIVKKEAEYVYNELKDCDRILDIGCGIGAFEQNLSNLNIVGLDICREMLKEARKRSNKNFVEGNAEELGFNDSVFDAVFAVTTLEFLGDYQRALKEIVRVTKPNGRILAMILNPNSRYFKEEVKKTSDYFSRIKHPNPKELRDYISRFYTITKEGYFLGIRGKYVFNTDEEQYASLYAIVGTIDRSCGRPFNEAMIVEETLETQTLKNEADDLKEKSYVADDVIDSM